MSWNELTLAQQSVWKNKQDYEETKRGARRILVDGVEINEHPLHVCSRCGSPYDDFISVGNPGGMHDDECPKCGSGGHYYIYEGKILRYHGWTGGKNGGHRYSVI